MGKGGTPVVAMRELIGVNLGKAIGFLSAEGWTYNFNGPERVARTL